MKLLKQALESFDCRGYLLPPCINTAPPPSPSIIVTPSPTNKQELQKRLDDYAAAHKCRRVDVFGVQPGLVASPLMVKTRSDIYPSAALTAAGAALGGQTPRRGAWSTLYAATAPELAGRGFRFYGPSAVLPLWHDVERKAQNRNAYRPAACLAVYESTLRILEELMQREAAAGAAAAAAADAAAASRKAAAAGIGPGSNVEALLKPLPSRIRHMYSGGLV